MHSYVVDDFEGQVDELTEGTNAEVDLAYANWFHHQGARYYSAASASHETRLRCALLAPEDESSDNDEVRQCRLTSC